MEDFKIEDYKSARKQNTKQFTVYGLILAAFIASTVYLLYASSEEKERFEMSKEEIESAMIRSVDSLESLLAESLTTNEELIEQIERQNKKIEEIANRPASAPKETVKKISVTQAVEKNSNLRDKLDRRRPQLVDLNFAYYSNTKIKEKSIDVKTFANVRQSSNFKELQFAPFQKSAYEIYYSADSDLNAALAIQNKLRNKKINAALYKVPKTNSKNEVVVIH